MTIRCYLHSFLGHFVVVRAYHRIYTHDTKKNQREQIINPLTERDTEYCNAFRWASFGVGVVVDVVIVVRTWCVFFLKSNAEQISARRTRVCQAFASISIALMFTPLCTRRRRDGPYSSEFIGVFYLYFIRSFGWCQMGSWWEACIYN